MSTRNKVLLAMVVLGLGIGGAIAFRRESPNSVTSEPAPLSALPWEKTGFAEPPSADPYLAAESEVPAQPAKAATAEEEPERESSNKKVSTPMVPLAEERRRLPPRPKFALDPVKQPMRTRSPERVPETVEHVIRDGDTPESIALRYLGDASRFDEIYQENRHVLRHPRKLIINATLRIPGRLRQQEESRPPIYREPEARTTRNPGDDVEAWQ